MSRMKGGINCLKSQIKHSGLFNGPAMFDLFKIPAREMENLAEVLGDTTSGTYLKTQTTLFMIFRDMALSEELSLVIQVPVPNESELTKLMSDV